MTALHFHRCEPDVARAKRDAEAYGRANRARIDAEWDALPDGRMPPPTREQIARADAEWDAMTPEGKLPDGWKYEGETR